jgi:hypothetical protein
MWRLKSYTFNQSKVEHSSRNGKILGLATTIIFQKQARKIETRRKSYHLRLRSNERYGQGAVIAGALSAREII